MAVASAGLYASLHLTPARSPCQYPTTQFFTGRMPYLSPNQQRQSTEGTGYNKFLFAKNNLASESEFSRQVHSDQLSHISNDTGNYHWLYTTGDQGPPNICLHRAARMLRPALPPGLQLAPQPLRGLLPILLLGEPRHDGCEQFTTSDCYPTASWLRFEPGPFCA